MSCPDWRRLALGERPDAADSNGLGDPAATRWQEALRHLDGGCQRCWQEAVAVDPTLIFRRLPAAELSPAQEADEVAAARQAVAAMRNASRRPRRALQQQHLRWAVAAGLTATALLFGAEHGWRVSGTAAPPRAQGYADLSHGGLPAAASDGAGLPAASGDTGSLPATASDHGGLPAASVNRGLPATAFDIGSLPAAGGAFGPAVSGRVVTPVALPSAVAAGARPSIEGLSRPEARVYQLDSPHMSVVMIVDAKLDV